MIINKKETLRNLILLGILCYLGFLSTLLFSEKQKKTIPKTIPKTQSTAPKRPRVIAFLINGFVLKDGKGAKNIKIKLIHIKSSSRRRTSSTESSKNKHARVILPTENITDSKGKFSFTIDPKQEGEKYKLIPKHPDFPAGKYFTPNNKEITLDRHMTLYFSFRPPKVIVNGKIKTSDGKSIRNAEVKMYEVIGYQYKYIDTKKNSNYYKFELDYEYFGKKVRILPRHPDATTSGFGFNPKEARFDLNLNTTVDFIYSGPLPDIIITNVVRTNSSIDVTVSNIGGLKAGRFRVETFYNVYDKTTGANPYNINEKYVSELAKGATKVVKFYLPKHPNKSVRWIKAKVDRDNHLVESDESNNKWGNWN